MAEAELDDADVMDAFLATLTRRARKDELARQQAELAEAPTGHKRELIEQARREKTKSMNTERRLKDFKTLLMSKEGSLINAWRRLLDTKGNGKCNEREFYEACRNMGFKGGKVLWKGLDKDESGLITFDELDPQAAQLLAEFRECVLQRYGSFEHAFRQWDTDGSRQLSKEELREACDEVGFRGNYRTLFTYLDADESGAITMDELDEAACEAIWGKDRPPVETDGPVHRGTAASRRNEEVGRANREAIEADRQRRKAKLVGSKTLDELKVQLRRKYGSLVRAWRHCLDPNGNGRVSEQQFYESCRAVGYAGSAKSAWQELDVDGSGIVTLDELDPVAAGLLQEFRTQVLARYGSWENAFLDWDRDGSKVISKQEFLQACHEVGLAGNGKVLFSYIDMDSSGTITMDELDEQAAQAIFGKEAHGPSADGSTGASRRYLKEGRENRSRVDRELTAARALDKGATDLKSFNQLLVNKFGSLVRAWHDHLDADGNGHLSENEFYQQARAVGFFGSLKSLWREVDPNGTKVVYFSELDPDCYAKAYAWYQTVLRSSGGSLEEAFARLDTDRKGDCDIEKLRCGKQVFEFLDITGSGYVTFEDMKYAARLLVGRPEPPASGPRSRPQTARPLSAPAGRRMRGPRRSTGPPRLRPRRALSLTGAGERHSTDPSGKSSLGFAWKDFAVTRGDSKLEVPGSKPKWNARHHLGDQYERELNTLYEALHVQTDDAVRVQRLAQRARQLRTDFVTVDPPLQLQN